MLTSFRAAVRATLTAVKSFNSSSLMSSSSKSEEKITLGSLNLSLKESFLQVLLRLSECFCQPMPGFAPDSSAFYSSDHFVSFGRTELLSQLFLIIVRMICQHVADSFLLDYLGNVGVFKHQGFFMDSRRSLSAQCRWCQDVFHQWFWQPVLRCFKTWAVGHYCYIFTFIFNFN